MILGIFPKFSSCKVGWEVGSPFPLFRFSCFPAWSFLGDHPLARVGRVGTRRKATIHPLRVKVLRVSWGQVVVGKWIPCLKLTETNLKMGKNPIRKGCRWCSLPLPPIFHGLWLLVNFRVCYLKKVWFDRFIAVSIRTVGCWGAGVRGLPGLDSDLDRIRITHWKNNFRTGHAALRGGAGSLTWWIWSVFFITLHSLKVTESHTNHV